MSQNFPVIYHQSAPTHRIKIYHRLVALAGNLRIGCDSQAVNEIRKIYFGWLLTKLSEITALK